MMKPLPLPFLLPRPVWIVAALEVLVLLALGNEYGFHRDELYFVVAGQHPALGYVDQGPITPILTALGVTLFGVSPLAIRVLPALVAGACVLICAAIARDMGGSTRAQAVAAVTMAASGIMFAGHFASTATYDVLGWALIAWLVARLLVGADQRLWLVVGGVAGVALLNKYTVGLLLLGLVVALLVERRWSVFRSPWAWAGVALAALIWAPNLVWQVQNDFPQLVMARHIAAATGSENRSQLILLQLLFAGPLLFPLLLLGWARLVLARDLRPWRAFAWAYALALGLTWFLSGKSYYAIGLMPVAFAAAATWLGPWLERGQPRLRLGLFEATSAASAVLMAVLVLPVLPPPVLVSSGIHDFNQELGEQIGWPELAAVVAQAAASLTAEERAHAVVITSNYAEAGAVELLLSDHPPVYSGHNSYWFFGRPADDTQVVLLVGMRAPAGLGSCTGAWRIDNRFDLPNEERGKSVLICRQVTASWAQVWPLYRHYD